MYKAGFYGHIPPQHYLKCADGRLKVHQVTLNAEVRGGVLEISVPEKLRLLTQYVAIGLWVNAPENTQQKIKENATVVNRNVFNSLALELRDGSKNLLDKLPLRLIEKVNNQGCPYYINGDFINFSESTIWNNDKDNAIDGEYVSILIDYIIPTKKHLQDIVNKNV